MTAEEFKEKKKQAYKDYQQALHAINFEYCFTHNPYKVGDVIKDHIGAIEIKSFKITPTMNDFPECVYIGIELNKDGKPSKKQTGRPVYQSNIIK